MALLESGQVETFNNIYKYICKFFLTVNETE
jgi:hypothetical protein